VGQFSFDTQNGLIVGWHIALSWDFFKLEYNISIDSTAGDIYLVDFGNEFCTTTQPATCDTLQSTSTVPGTWSYGADIVTALQKQLTHVTSEMNFYRNGVVNWEARALAWQARAYYWCKAAKGSC
jgi:hypothetical protein